MIEIIENGLYRLSPKEGETLRTWARHNLLIATTRDDGQIILKDTYWSGNPTTYKLEEVQDRIELAFDLNFSREVAEAEYKQYDDKNRFFIPIGGSSEKYLIDTRASKSRKIIVELIEHKIDDHKLDIRYKTREIERLEQTLADVESGGNIDNICV